MAMEAFKYSGTENWDKTSVESIVVQFIFTRMSVGDVPEGSSSLMFLMWILPFIHPDWNEVQK